MGNHHIANWMIGQVRDEEQSEEKIRTYAALIGANEDDAAAAFQELPVMSRKQFEQVAKALFILANQFSDYAYQNVQQARFISERKQSEQDLIAAKEKAEESEGKLRQILDAFDFPIYISEPDFTIVYTNKAMGNLIGNDKIGTKCYQSIYNLDKNCEWCIKGTILVNKMNSEYDLHIPETDQYRHVKNIIFENNQKLTFYQDITERKRAEELLQEKSEQIAAQNEELNANNLELIAAKEKAEESEAKQRTLFENLKHERILLRTIIDSLPDSIYVKDIECRKILANEANFQSVGFDKEEDIIGKTDFEIFPVNVAEKFFEDDQKIIKQGISVLNREEYYIRDNGNIKWLLTSKLPLYDDTGKIVGLVGIGHDITNRKKAEEDIKAKMVELERFHKLTVGRELTMIELKKEVNNLLNKLGQDYKYKIIE